MANTFELISAVTVGSGGAASIDFSSIPATFTDLCIKMSVRSDQAAGVGQDVYIRFNNDNAANYSFRRVYGDGSSAASDGVTSSATAGRIGRTTNTSATANTFANTECYIPNYLSSVAKSISGDAVDETNGTAAIAQMTASIWTGTAAITSLKLFPFTSATNFVQYSTAYLYGVKNA